MENLIESHELKKYEEELRRQELSKRGLEELDDKKSKDYRVALLWNRQKNQVVVEIVEIDSGAFCEFEVENQSAIDAFEHPMAYAAMGGIATEQIFGRKDFSESEAA